MLLNVSSLKILCLNPIKIRNPNYGRDYVNHSVFKLKDTHSEFIRIPCGHCPECIHSKQMSLVQRMQMESLRNHLFFATLTYSNDTIPVFTTSKGFVLRFADITDLQNMFKRLRKRNAFGRPFTYFAVSERGSHTARPHFHIIFMLPKAVYDSWLDILNLEGILYDEVSKEWKRNISRSTKRPEFVPLCKFVKKFKNGKINTSFDLHYVSPRNGSDSGSSVAFYVIKYLLKDSKVEMALQQALNLNHSRDEYKIIYNTVKSRYLMSKSFGFMKPDDSDSDAENPIRDYILSCISNSKLDPNAKFASYFNPDDGRSFPLSRFYKNKFLTLDDALFFRSRSPHNTDDTIVDEDRTVTEIFTDYLKKYSQYEKQLEILRPNNVADDFDSLFGE